jgi:hypothetical protein
MHTETQLRLAAVAVRVGRILQGHESWTADTFDDISATYDAAGFGGATDGLFDFRLPCVICSTACRMSDVDDHTSWVHIAPADHPATIESTGP